MLNDYNTLANSYRDTNTKPDKLYSTLPTILTLAGNVKDKTILDLGCGEGFFTVPLANTGAKKVIGIDNSESQIKLAHEYSQRENIEYNLKDIFVDPLPVADVIVAPYLLNYPSDKALLKTFFKNAFHSLHQDGKLVLVVDLPEGYDLRKYGLLQTMKEGKHDGAEIQIHLFNDEKEICTLTAFYFAPETFEQMLKEAGFTDINWHKAIISDEGIQAYGKEFWEGFLDQPELGYLTAVKK